MEKLIIAVEESDSSLGFYRTTGEKIARISTGFWPHEIAVTRDGTTAYVTNFGIKDYDENIGMPGASISVIDVHTACEIRRLYTFANAGQHSAYRAPHGVKLSPDETRLFVNVEGKDEEMLVFDLETTNVFPERSFKLALPSANRFSVHQKESKHFDIQEGTHNFIFSVDGRHLFLSAGKHGLLKIDASSGATVQRMLEDPTSPVRGLTFDVQQKHLIVSGKGKITIVDPDTFAIVKEIANLNVGQLLYSQPTPDGKYILAPAVWESVLLVIDIATHKVVKRITTGVDPIHIVFDEAKAKAYVSHGRSKFILEIDLKTLSESNKIHTQGGPNGLAIVSSPGFRPKKTLTFGACLPLSGVTATEGREIRLGYQFWQERTNDAGGILVGDEAYLVDLIFRDTESRSLGPDDKAFIQKQAEDLIQNDKVDFLLGSYPTPPNAYIAEVAHQRKIPMVTATGAGEKLIYGQGYETICGIMSPARIYLSGTIEVLLREHAANKPTSIVFLSCDDKAALEDATETARFAQSQGLKLVSIREGQAYRKVSEGVYSYSHNANDYDDAVQALKEANPDLFFNTGHLVESERLLRSIIKHHFAPKALAFSVGPTVPSFRTTFGDLCKYIFGSAQWNEYTSVIGQDEFETPANFSSMFSARFSMAASYFSAGGYACGIVFKHALVSASTTDKEIVNTFLRATDLQTFFAPIKLDSRGLNNEKPIITIQVQNREGMANAEVPVWPKDLSGETKSIYPFPGWKK